MAVGDTLWLGLAFIVHVSTGLQGGGSELTRPRRWLPTWVPV